MAELHNETKDQANQHEGQPKSPGGIDLFKLINNKSIQNNNQLSEIKRTQSGFAKARSRIDFNQFKEKIQAQVDAEKENPLHQNFGIGYILNSIDIYGKHISFYVGKNKSTVTNEFGGCMTILFVVLVLAYITAEIVKM